MASRISPALAICHPWTSTATPVTAPSEHATRASTGASSSRSARPASTAARSARAHPEAREHHVPHERRVRARGGIPALPALPPRIRARSRRLARDVAQRVARARADRRRRARRRRRRRPGAAPRYRRAPAAAPLRQAPRCVADRGGADASRAAREAASPRDAHEDGRRRVRGRLRSLRRFNDTFQRLYGQPPSALRRETTAAIASVRESSAITLTLGYAAPTTGPR